MSFGLMRRSWGALMGSLDPQPLSAQAAKPRRRSGADKKKQPAETRQRPIANGKGRQQGRRPRSDRCRPLHGAVCLVDSHHLCRNLDPIIVDIRYQTVATVA
jgi:hypothetical protein